MKNFYFYSKTKKRLFWITALDQPKTNDVLFFMNRNEYIDYRSSFLTLQSWFLRLYNLKTLSYYEISKLGKIVR